MTVNTPPGIAAQPQSQAKCVGGSATFAVSATGGAVSGVRWGADGVNNLTQDGWSFHLNSGDPTPTKSYDFSTAVSQDTLWRINDNNSPNSAYMRGVKDPGGMSSSQGIVMARIRVDSASSLSGGNFGYSVASADQSMVVCVRPNALAYKTANSSGLLEIGNSTVSGNQGFFRVYAFRYYLSAGVLTADAWISNGDSWSANPADWTQLMSGGNIAQSQTAYRDSSNNALTGLLLGSYGSSSNTWDGYVDYICYSAESANLNPWDFNPVASAGLPAAFQWRKGGIDIGGATASSYTINPVGISHAGNYDCVLTNSCGSATSNAATLTTNTAPAIATHPQSQTVCPPATATLTVAASGVPAPTYQWRKNGQDISGEASASLSTGEAGNYDCVVTNSCGMATSNAATLTVNAVPAITAQPQSQTKCLESSVTFAVTASGGALTYRWRKDGVDIGGATGSSYAIDQVEADDANSYDCVVTNPCGTATSNAATLTVDSAAPAISDTAATPGQLQCAITWTTDEPATSQVEYGPTAGYGSSTALNSELVTSHSVSVTGLTPGATYHYCVKSKDSCDAESASGDLGFVTVADTAAPETTITSGPGQDSLQCSMPVTFQWSGSDDCTPADQLQFQWRIDGGSPSGWSGATSQQFTSLSEGAHTFEVAAKDLMGNVDQTPASRQFRVNLNPPAVSAVIAAPDVITCVITWTTGVHARPSDVHKAARRRGSRRVEHLNLQVRYGGGPGVAGGRRVLDGGGDHSVLCPVRQPDIR